MTTGTAILFSLPIAIAAIDVMLAQHLPATTSDLKDIGLVGALAAAVVALWQDKKQDRADRKELSNHIAASTQEIIRLGHMIETFSQTRHELVDALRELEGDNQKKGARR